MKPRSINSLMLAGLMLAQVNPVRAGGDDTNADVSAITKVEGGDMQGAAEDAGRHNSAAKNTLPWYQQSATALIQQAFAYKAALDFQDSRRAALAAAQILTFGFKQQSDKDSSGNRSQIYVTLAQLNEAILGDTQAARRYYQLALKESSGNPLALAALANYQAQDDKAKRIQRRGH